MAYHPTQKLSPRLPKLIKKIVEGGPTPEEYLLMGVIALMDESFEKLLANEQVRQHIAITFAEIETYLCERESH